MVFRPALWPTVFAILATGILIWLGMWQLERLEWKNDLVTRVSERTELPAIPLPDATDWTSLDIDANEYRPVALDGTFNHLAEFHAFTSLGEPKGPLGGPGYWVLTPLVLTDGGTVLVNRGFVPADRKVRESRLEGLPQGPVTITGLLRKSAGTGLFVPEPDLAKNIWYARNVGAMAAHAGITDAAPFYVDAHNRSVSDLPQGGETRLVFVNNHFDYALTWFGLAVALFAVYLGYHRSIGRLQFSKAST